MRIHNNLLKKLFENVYFFNGTAYAGKSTMVKMLAEKYDGICCGENYHNNFLNLTDTENQPNLSYISTMKDWQEFLSRTPEEYAKWIEDVGEEASELEILRLIQLCESGRKIFVDTNISVKNLKEISSYKNVAIMVSAQSTSVERFFDREDEEKQFILSQIKSSPDPEKTMLNYKNGLALINSLEKYEAFKNSGFFVLERDDDRTLDETMAILEKHFELV